MGSETSTNVLDEPTLTRKLPSQRAAQPQTPQRVAVPAPPPSIAAAELDARHIGRIRWLVSVIFLIAALAALSTSVLGGDPGMKRIFMGGIAAAAASGVWLVRATRDPTKVSRWQLRAAWYLCSAGICTSFLYFGLFSGAPMVAVLAIFFTATFDYVGPVAVYGTIASFHAVAVTILIGFGFPDPGIVTFAESYGVGKIVVVEILFQTVMLGTLVIARVIRRTLLTVVTQLEQSSRVAGHYEVLLEDARNALVTSLRSVGGGRFSYQTFGSYRLGRLIGEGAMGEVYEAIDTTRGTSAAVKVLRREALGEPSIIRRFLSEARIVASLKSEHIVRVLETGDITGDKIPYIAMERLSGRDLRQLLKESPEQRLAVDRVVALVAQVADGIGEAHNAGIIHRDLKPSNLFLDDGGLWKILDFGVSRVAGEGTAENALVGTPSFMAPEQIAGGDVDGRADVFALGVIAYRALTGKLPFTGSRLEETLHKIVHDTPSPPSTLVPALPSELDAVLGTALAKRPAERFATAGAFADALGAALARDRRDD
jgi:serine/threonine-protein kinase